MLVPGMDNAPPAASASSEPAASLERSGEDEREYPDKLDAALLRIAVVCGLASVMALLDSTVVAVAQRAFVAQFGSTQAIVAWTMAGYLLAMSAVTPLTGWAADRFGTKRPFMGSLLVFSLGSLLCAVAPNILLLIVFRMLQGIGGGMLLPLSFVILTRESGPKRLGRLMAIGAIPLLLGPIGGPILGGWLIGAYGWKWIFLINVPIGLTACALAAVFFPKDRPAPSETLDVTGALLLSPGVATLLAGVSAIPGRRTVADPYVLIPVSVGLALIVAFVFHAWRRTDHPLIDLRLFGNRVVTQANVTQLVFAATFFGVALLVPSYFQVVLHQTPMQTGMRIVVLGLGVVVTMPLAGALMDKRGPGTIVLVGLLVTVAGLGVFTFGVARQANYSPTLLAGLVIMGLGVGCTSTPLSAACVQTLAPHQVARGTTLLSVNDQVGGAIGAALMAVLLTNQLNRDDQAAENKLAPLQLDAPADPSAIPHLSHAYTVVFVVAVALALCTVIPAAFLPKKPAA